MMDEDIFETKTVTSGLTDNVTTGAHLAQELLRMPSPVAVELALYLEIKGNEYEEGN
jgi:hypothetical protein